MPVTFLIPGPLRAFAAGKSQVVIEPSPATLADALEALWKRCPGIRDRVVTEQAQIREHINVFVGNEDVRYTGGLQTPLAEGAEISIVPAVSGGMNHRIAVFGFRNHSRLPPDGENGEKTQGWLTPLRRRLLRPDRLPRALADDTFRRSLNRITAMFPSNWQHRVKVLFADRDGTPCG